MELKAVLDVLQIPAASEPFRDDWDVADKLRPVGEIEFLAPQFVRWTCEAAHLTGDVTEHVLRTAKRVAADENLRALAWYLHYVLFQRKGSARIKGWPILSDALGEDAGMFYVVILLSGTPKLQEIHRKRGIPADIIRDTVLDLKLCLETEDYTTRYGHPGISPRILSWLLGHWRGELYRLGRLQFVPGHFHGRIRAFRHHSKNTVVALSDRGVEYRADGQVQAAGGVKDDKGAWISTLDISSDRIAGYPIDPRGDAVHQLVRLPAHEWKQVLSFGTPTLDMHIPAGEPMDYDACGKSIHQAMEFFPEYFPDFPFLAFTCFSWILDNQFEQLLPVTSNLVRFQKEVYLFPILSGPNSTLNTVFGTTKVDLATLPRRTTMQRAFAAHLDKGGTFQAGACFLLPEDLKWGAQVYRRQTLPWAAK
jgi:hypothetical protein